MRSARSSQPLIRASTVAVVVGLLAAAGAVQMVRFAPAPLDRFAVGVLEWATQVNLAVTLVLTATVAIAIPIVGRSVGRRDDAALVEEPHFPRPTAPECRGRCPVVAFRDLEPGAGASTLTLNLAALVATEGRPVTADGAARRPRPLCLLSEGHLADALGIDADPLRQHLDRSSGRIVEDLIDGASRHPSGCELLCLPRGRVGRHQLRLLRQALDRHYDLIVLDCDATDDDLREGAEDTADAVLAVGLPSVRSAAAATRLLEAPVSRSRLATTVLVLNQISRQPCLLEELPLGFGHVAFFPHEYLVQEADRRGLPWTLTASSTSGRIMRDLTSQLVPELFAEAEDASAA